MGMKWLDFKWGRPTDAVQSLGPWFHGGRGQGGTGRRRKPVAGVLLCFERKEEEGAGVGQVGLKAKQASRAAGPTGPETEENFFSE
jgi:hypothetical protein